MPRANQSKPLRLVPNQVRAEQRALTDAFLRVASALPKRPEPRVSWDSRARSGERAAAHPATDAVNLCRGAMRSAIETGNAETVRATRLAIEGYFADCAEAACTVGLVLMDRPVVADVVRDECDAVSAIVAANESQSPGALETARQKFARCVDAGTRFFAGAAIGQRAAVR